MRLHVVACQVFSRELCAIAAQSSHVVELDLLPQGLHDTPALLREMVGEAIQKVEGRYQKGISKYLPDAIILGYGLCSNGVVGLQAGKIPLVIPRTDDCMGIFLGSQRRYLDLFHQYPGIYWLNHGWIENAFIPTKEQLEKNISNIGNNMGRTTRSIYSKRTGVGSAVISTAAISVPMALGKERNTGSWPIKQRWIMDGNQSICKEIPACWNACYKGNGDRKNA